MTEPGSKEPVKVNVDAGTFVPPRRASQFLERKTYRRARLEDAARLLPVLGLFLFVLPITIQTTDDGFGGETVRWLFFFMAVWLGLIGLAALVSRALRRGGGQG